ncbi:hypothetical protein ACLIA0_14565 [Bacillaceae bacterium W0354]
MSVEPITSFIVRCQHMNGDNTPLKIRLTHVQSNEDTYFEKLEDAFQKMKEIVAEKG